MVTVEHLRQRMENSFAIAPPVTRREVKALLDIAEAAQELNELGNHVTRIDVDRDMNELAAALSRLDTEGQR